MGADSDEEELAEMRAASGSQRPSQAGSSRGGGSSGRELDLDSLRARQSRLNGETARQKHLFTKPDPKTAADSGPAERSEAGAERGRANELNDKASRGDRNGAKASPMEEDNSEEDEDDKGEEGGPTASTSAGGPAGIPGAPQAQGEIAKFLPPGVAVEDEADLDFGLRAAFPKGFGRQEEAAAPLENKHDATRRKDGASGADQKPKGAKGKAKGFGKFSLNLKISDQSKYSAPSAPVAPATQPGPSLAHASAGPLAPGDREEAGKGAEAVPGSAPGSAETESGAAREPSLVGPMPVGPGTAAAVQNGGSSAKSSGLKGPKGPLKKVPRKEDKGLVVGPMRPTSQSYAKGEGSEGEGDEDGFVGPPPPGAKAYPPRDEEEEEEGDEEDEEEGGGDEEEDEYRVPISNEVVLKGHTKIVAALAVDPSGARVLTGSYDYTVRMYDFGGMDSRLKAFRELTPFDGHQVRALTWSPTGDMFFAATGNAQAKVYDRDGRTKGEFVRGDMYIRDLRNTSGHLSGLTAAEWHPHKRHTVLSASEDGSIRIWDVTNFKKQVQVVKPKLARPGRVPVTACKWGPGGNHVAAGLNDGSLQVWSVKSGWGSRPDLFLDAAHERGEDVSGLQFSGDASMLISRSTDGTLKVWDVRKFKEPVKTFSDLPCHYAQTNIAWSPDERLFLTGTSVEKDGRSSEIVFIDRQELQVVRRTGVSDKNSVVRVEWHPKLNQIFASAGDKKEGGTHILYDPTLSEKGALLCVARAPRKTRPEDLCASVMAPAIHNPHALPLFREEPSRKRQREKARKDPVQSRKPDLPVEGHGHGGRLGTAKGTLLTQYLLKEAGMLKETWMEEDPREAILRYAEVAEKDPQIIAPAYAKSQPKPMFYESDEEKEED